MKNGFNHIDLGSFQISGDPPYEVRLPNISKSHLIDMLNSGKLCYATFHTPVFGENSVLMYKHSNYFSTLCILNGIATIMLLSYDEYGVYVRLVFS